MGLHWQYGVVQNASGAAALSVALDSAETILAINLPQPDQSSVVDTSAADLDVTATASGGDGSYSYAWTVTEEDDLDNLVTVLAAGTQNGAQYDDITWRVICPQIFDPATGPTGSQGFLEAVYTLTCTVTDGNGDRVTINHGVTLGGQ